METASALVVNLPQVSETMALRSAMNADRVQFYVLAVAERRTLIRLTAIYVIAAVERRMNR